MPFSVQPFDYLLHPLFLNEIKIQGRTPCSPGLSLQAGDALVVQTASQTRTLRGITSLLTREILLIPCLPQTAKESGSLPHAPRCGAGILQSLPNCSVRITQGVC